MECPFVILNNVETWFRHFRHHTRDSTSFLLENQPFTASASFGRGRALVSDGSDMFRISTIDTQRERRLVVEGTLVQPWVAELRRIWCDAGASLDGRKLVIDLNDATMIDAEGEAAISDLIKDGAKFRCSDVFTKHVLKQLAHRCHTRLHNILNRPASKGERCSEEEEQ